MHRQTLYRARKSASVAASSSMPVQAQGAASFTPQ